ncbi:RHS repeat-associated core domain-containing protein [Actinoplanes derwentensis]|uniref:RHS repeat-associated core domain-containing protein n=1 Tax=Actinoplanes derwentensis TaxID=113562 RepID=UPI000A4C8482|nr:RHS repeat-associated core domain-containing protein [Actinoplanes derwentensis]GID87263.1 hypothetical protein Ade03nite_61870 [Actinoplanes derwentensis]
MPAERLTYDYNSLGQPITVDSLYGSTNQAYVTGTDYNALGQLDQVKLYTGTGAGGRVYTKYTRELETGRLTGIRTDRDSVAPYILTDTTYRYDDAGNITRIADAAPDPADDVQCFGYDNLARLARACTPASGDCAAAPSASVLGGPAPYWHSWIVDPIGNRTSETVHTTDGETTTDYQYPASGSTSVRPHAVTGTTGARTGSYTYDATGNTLTRPTATAGTQILTWDAEGHVDTVTDTTGTTTYLYDPSGNRLVQRDPTGTTLYLPGQEIRYTKSTAKTEGTRYYSHAGATIGSRTAAALTWLSPDHQGTASVAVNATTQQATTRRQTPYGTPRGGTAGAWPNNRGYVGGVIDDTGLIHLGAREYDLVNGRFISVDSVQDLASPQQWNGYSYANNSPITLSDPSGLDPCIGGGGGCHYDGTDPGGNGHNGEETDEGEYVGGEDGGGTTTEEVAQKTYGVDLKSVNQTNLSTVYHITWCTKNPAACAGLQNKRGAEALEMIKETSGYSDFEDCATGGGAEPCAWAASNFIPFGFGKALKALKAARVADAAADAARTVEAAAEAKRASRAAAAPKFTAHTNAAGGEVYLTDQLVDQSDFRKLVHDARRDGDEVHILSGSHGTPEGKLVYERDFYEKDVEAFGYFQNVHVYDVATMSDAEITKVLRSPGTIVGGICFSSRCLAGLN